MTKALLLSLSIGWIVKSSVLIHCVGAVNITASSESVSFSLILLKVLQLNYVICAYGKRIIEKYSNVHYRKTIS